MAITTVSPQQLCDLAKSDKPVDLIDVRTPAEFQEVHVPFARNVPLDRLDAAKIACGRNGSAQPLYLICRSGSRGKQACEKFLAAGYTNVVNVEGGTLAWDQAGFPVVRGKKMMSLERQVRLVAGLLIVTGTLFGLLCPSVLDWSGGHGWRRAGFRRSHGFVRHGTIAGSHALESD